MLASLPAHFRDYGLSSDVRTLLVLRKAMARGLVKTLGDMYTVLKGVIVTEPKEMGPYTKAFYMYFLRIGVAPGERLLDAVIRSETFRQWLEDSDTDIDALSDSERESLAERFLDAVHLTKYDIQEVLDGRELFDQDDADLADKDDDQGGPAAENVLDRMADYSDLSMEEILERLEKVREQQRGRHSGGSHWIGTGGISPYGHGGAAKNGVRVGGTGGGRMARAVMEDRNYWPVDMERTLNDNNVDAALSSLKGVSEESHREVLDIPNTISRGIQRGGLFLPEMRSETEEKLRLVVMIDNGGYSMMGHVRVVRDLFKKMRTRFAHDLEVYYFHNSIYAQVYSDPQRSQPVDMEQILSKEKDYRLFIIGDASMAPHELNSESVHYIQELAHRFKKTVWLNPEPEDFWRHTFTIQAIMQLVDMFPLTPSGIERAVRHMNSKTRG